MKLTEEQIWKCNIDGEGGVHICLEHQNVVDFARAVEREIGYARAELWLKRINEAVLAEREACAKVCDERAKLWPDEGGDAGTCAIYIRERGENMKDDDDTMCYRSELEAAVKAEREAIIQMVRQYTNNKDLENAIRARGQDPMPLFDDWNKDWTK